MSRLTTILTHFDALAPCYRGRENDAALFSTDPYKGNHWFDQSFRDHGIDPRAPMRSIVARLGAIAVALEHRAPADEQRRAGWPEGWPSRDDAELVWAAAVAAHRPVVLCDCGSAATEWLGGVAFCAGCVGRERENAMYVGDA